MVHALGLQVAELQRRLGSGSDDSGTPTSKESISAKARCKAERQARQEQQDQEQERQPRGGSSRRRSTDKAQGGQPGHPGHGLRREPNPNQQLPIDAPAKCRGCGDDLTGAADAGIAWSQIWDVKIIPWRTEYLLPRRRCGCTVTTVARPPDGGVVNSISFGPVLNTRRGRVDRVRQRPDRTLRGSDQDSVRTGRVGRVRRPGQHPPRREVDRGRVRAGDDRRADGRAGPCRRRVPPST